MSINVFLADDHAVMRDGLRVFLESQSDIAVVGDAADGRQTVGCVSDLKPDIVIIDISMPKLNGIETIRHIATVSPATRVIILSMHSTSEHIFRALQAGASGYVPKESVGNEVVDAVRTVYQGQRYLSPKISDTLIHDYIRQREEAADQSPLTRLSEREREVLQLVVEGKSSFEIADILHLSPKTIDTYRSRLMQKLDVESLPELVKFAIQHGLTSLH